MVLNCIDSRSLPKLLILIVYVLGDDASISKGSFMQTKYLCVLIHIRNKGEVCLKPSSDGASFGDHFCYLCFIFIFVMLSCLFPAALWSPTGNGLTS